MGSSSWIRKLTNRCNLRHVGMGDSGSRDAHNSNWGKRNGTTVKGLAGRDNNEGDERAAIITMRAWMRRETLTAGNQSSTFSPARAGGIRSRASDFPA